MSHLTDISNGVAELSDVIDSAEQLLDNLSALLKANANDPAEIKAIADTLTAKKEELAAKVAANTPADPNA